MARWKNIMKCYPFEEKRLIKWQPPYIVQPKYDGVRCRAVPLESGEFMLLSSEEHVIYSVPHINETLKNLPPQEYDGELYHHGMRFEEIVSITSRTVNLHPNHRLIDFHIFDIVNSDPQAERIRKVFNLKRVPYINPAPFWIAENLDEIMKVYDRLINLGYEGIIVRHFEAPYERKRSLYVMKFKPKKEDTYEIVGGVEEISIEGTPKGTLGALVVKSGDGNTFQVGSGFTRDQRISLWKNLQDLKGKYVRIQYQHLSSGRKVPRFPVFVEIVESDN